MRRTSTRPSADVPAAYEKTWSRRRNRRLSFPDESLPSRVDHGVPPVAHQAAGVQLDVLQALAAHRLDRVAADGGDGDAHIGNPRRLSHEIGEGPS